MLIHLTPPPPPLPQGIGNHWFKNKYQLSLASSGNLPKTNTKRYPLSQENRNKNTLKLGGGGGGWVEGPLPRKLQAEFTTKLTFNERIVKGEGNTEVEVLLC